MFYKKYFIKLDVFVKNTNNLSIFNIVILYYYCIYNKYVIELEFLF